MSSKITELTIECKRQYENCLYTAVSQLIWLKWLRGFKVFLTIAPLVLGSLGSWEMLTSAISDGPKRFAAICAFLAGVLSTIYSTLKLDAHIADVKTASGELTILRDRFRQAALISSKKTFDEFEEEFKTLRDRLDKVRTKSLTPPDPCFWWAQRKIKAGDYSFDIDESV